jgi:tetratricopeptide (TPR) repeat protein
MASVPLFLRLIARGWWTIVAGIGGALLTNVLAVFFAHKPEDWWPAIEGQVGELVVLIHTYPLPSAFIGVAVLAVTAFGFIESRHITMLDRLAAAQLAHDVGHAHVRVGAVEQDVAATKQRVAATAEQVQQIAATLVAAPPALNVIVPSGLPRPFPLIGRQDELTRLMVSLRAGTSTGVFAIEGMGGVGKSALAAEAVGQLAEDRAAFPGGAAWISCEGLEGAAGLAEVWSRVARALLLERVAAQVDPDARRAGLAVALHDRPLTVLAFDNVEPGLDADALLDTLAVGGHTALLLTARGAVAPDRLQALTLAPLPDPDAAALFAQRLRQTDETRPTREDEENVASLVGAVGGLPLALELTAAYAGVQHLPLTAVTAELEADGLNAAAYHMSPKQVNKAPVARFDRSWRALTASQQRLFAGLALLAGASFPRAGALALAGVAGEDGATGHGADAQHHLAALVAYALVEPLAGGRLRLHPLLREYAALRLVQYPAEVEERLGDAAASYWLSYAKLHDGQGDDGLEALEAEAPGLHGALEWAHDHGRAATTVALAHALWRFWRAHWHVPEGLRYLPWGLEAAEAQAKESGSREDARRALHLRLGYGQALAASGSSGERRRGGQAEHLLCRCLDDASALDDHETACAALATLGDLALLHGEVNQAGDRYRELLRIGEAGNDLKWQCIGMRGLGDVVLKQNDNDKAEAEEHYRQALLLSEQAPHQREKDTVEQALLFSLGQVAQQRGKLDRAEEYYGRALALAEKTHSPQDKTTYLYCLGQIALQRGRFDHAETMMDEVLDLLRHAQDSQGVSVCLSRLGEIALKREQWPRAEEYFQQALKLAAIVEDVHGQAAIHYQLGKLHLWQSQLEPAAHYFSQALELNRDLQDQVVEGMCRTGLGQVALKRDQLDEAEDLFEKALVLLDQVNDPLGEAMTQLRMAQIAERRGRLEFAENLYRQSLRLAREVDSGLDIAEGLVALGRFLIEHRNDRERGCPLLAEGLQRYVDMKLDAPAIKVRALALQLGCDTCARPDHAGATVDRGQRGSMSAR